MLPKHIISAAVNHAVKCGSEESCGLVVKIGRRLKYIPADNVYHDPTGNTTREDAFAISDLFWMAAEDAGDIVCVVHSHPGQGDNPIPSIGDIESCNQGDVPWVIVTEMGGAVEIVPDNLQFVGRRFVLGVSDCYGLVMDWHARNGVTLPDFRVPYPWWERGENRFMDNLYSSGFRECEPNTPGAMVVMQVASSVPNHCGVYLKDGRLLHHMFGHLSGTIPFSVGYYRDNVVKWVRHKDLPQEITRWL